MRILQSLRDNAAQLRVGRRWQQRGQLGWMQRWYAAQPTQRVVVSVLELPARTSRDALEPALRALCVRHVALGMCLERSLERLRFRPLTAADPLPWHDSQLEPWPLAAALTHVTFAPPAPLFRVALTPDAQHVLCAFDHLIADGISVALLASELARLLSGEGLPPLVDAGSATLDARLDLRPTLGELARTLRPDRTPVRLTPTAASAGTRSTRILPLQLTAAETRALHSLASAHGVTLHAALSAAALLASMEALDLRRGWLRLSTPLSLRPLCEPVPDGPGVYITSVDTALELTPERDLWELARAYQSDLRRQRPRAHHKVGLLALAGDLRALASKYEAQHQGRTATLEVSNVGRVHALPAGTTLWLTQGAHYHAALFVLTVAISQQDESLRACLSYPEPLVTRARAERFSTALLQRLRAHT